MKGTVRRWPGEVWRILGGTLIISIGSYIVVPFLAVYLNDLGLAPSVIAGAFIAKLWGQRGFMVVGGWLCDRAGPRAAMRVGVLLRVLSYGALMVATGPVSAVLGTALLGVSSGIYIPAGKTALAGFADRPADLDELYMMRNVANSAGNFLGPALGSLLTLLSLRLSMLVSGLLFVALLPVIWSAGADRTPTDTGTRASGGLGSFLGGEDADRRWKLCWLGVAWAGFGLAYYQIDVSIPRYTTEQVGSWFVGVLFTVSSILVVVLQVPLSKITARLRSGPMAFASFAGFAIVFALFTIGTWYTLLPAIVLFSATEVVLEPRLDREVAVTVDRRVQGIAFGLVGVAQASGGSLANVATAVATGPHGLSHSYWLYLSLSVAVIGLALLPRWARGRVSAGVRGTCRQRLDVGR